MSGILSLSKIKRKILRKYGYLLELNDQKRLFDSINSKLLIIANGPSAYGDLEYLSQHQKKREEFKLLVVNHFAQTEYMAHLKPELYILSDPNLFSSNSSEVINMQREKTLKVLNEIDWPMCLIIKKGNPTDFIKEKITNTLITLVSYSKSVLPAKYSKYNNYIYRSNPMLLPSASVSIKALAVGLAFGYKKIFLTGIDSTWPNMIRVDEQNRLYWKEEHFYGKDTRFAFKNAQQTELFSMEEIIQTWSDLFLQAKILLNVANERNQSIINLSNESLIDVFEKKKLDSL